MLGDIVLYLFLVIGGWLLFMVVYSFLLEFYLIVNMVVTGDNSRMIRALEKGKIKIFGNTFCRSRGLLISIDFDMYTYIYVFGVELDSGYKLNLSKEKSSELSRAIIANSRRPIF